MSDDHNVFISWSGTRSRWVADAFLQWLPVVLQSVKPWMSPEIDKGTRGQDVISDKLNKVKIGIVCLTPENMKEPWILFEASALSKAVDRKSYVCTYLLGGLKDTDVEPPLSVFQHTKPDKQDTLRMIITINAALGVEPVPSATLERAFEGWWPGFEKLLKTMPEVGEAVVVKRSTEDLVSEVLEIARGQANVVRTLRNQIAHIEHTLNRAPFADNGGLFSTNLFSGGSIPIASMASNIPFITDAQWVEPHSKVAQKPSESEISEAASKDDKK
jgi:hypothetical protein